MMYNSFKYRINSQSIYIDGLILGIQTLPERVEDGSDLDLEGEMGLKFGLQLE